MKRIIVLAAVAMCMTGCKSEKYDICDTWIHSPQTGWGVGFSLNDDGTAKAINLGVMLFDTWDRESDNLIIQGVNVVSGIGLEFTDTLQIDMLTADSLIVSSGSKVFRLGRM